MKLFINARRTGYPTRSKRLTYSKKKTFREALSIEADQE